MIHFESPKNQSSIIKVIGVGGGGGNAVNYMHKQGIDGVDFIVCNTDSQALALSPIPNKIQLGPHLTQGLGAGANPSIGQQAGEESIEDIAKILQVNTKMAFITAGMGGGTGTGAAPIIAKVCSDHDILTVGIVTTPFTYEGNKRLKQAQEGIKAMRQYVDTILIISNDKLRQQYGNLPFTQAFAKADDVLATAAKCITDLITVDGKVNLDFNDVQTVMKNGGVAILGSSTANGEDRAKQAVEDALNSPLLNDSEIKGAKWILLNITSAPGEFEHTLDELEIIQGYVQQQAGNNCDIILGMGHNELLENNIAVTIIATGFEYNEISGAMPEPEVKKEVFALEDTKTEQKIGNKAVETNTITIEEKPAATPELDLLPKLIIKEEKETPEVRTSFTQNYEIKEEPQEVVSENRIVFELTPEDTSASIQNIKEEPKKEIPIQKEEPANPFVNLELVINNNEKPSEVKPQTPQQRGEQFMSDMDKEAKRQLEKQKQEFAERASRLRAMSFKQNPDEVNQQSEHTAGTHHSAKNEGYLSGNSVDANNGNINTINNFLEGRKSD